MKPTLDHTRVWDCDECGAQKHTSNTRAQQCPFCHLPMIYQWSYVGKGDHNMMDLTDSGVDGKMELQD